MNNRLSLEVLHARRPTLNYVSPAICEAIFSGSSFATLVLDSLSHLSGITGLRFEFNPLTGRFRLFWDIYPGALCYNVYQADDFNNPAGNYTLVATCIPNPVYELPAGDPACFLVTAITPVGETPFSEIICVGFPPETMLFHNVEYTATCPPGFTGAPVTVPAGTYSSSISQANADQKAIDAANGALNCIPIIGGCAPGGINTPCDISIPGSGSLGTVVPDPSIAGHDEVLGTFPAGDYRAVYIGGAYKEDDNPFPGEWKIVGYKTFRDGGVNDTPWTNRHGGSQAAVEALVPIGLTDSFTHTGGTMGIRTQRVGTATNFVAGSPNPSFEFFQDTVFPTQPDRVRIHAFDPSVFSPCDGEPASAGLAWDGTFTDTVFGPPTFYGWDSDNSFESLNGQNMDFAEVFYDNSGLLSTPTGCGWSVEIFLTNLDVWLGYKATGIDPVGCYDRASGCSAGPETLTIESY